MKEKYSDGIIYPDYIRTHENVVDLLTKSLPRPQFEYLRSFILGSNHHLQEFHYEIDHTQFSFRNIVRWINRPKSYPYMDPES